MVRKARRHISENSHLDDSRLTIHRWPNLHEYLKYSDDTLDSGWRRHPHGLIHRSWLGKSVVHCSDEQPVNQACTRTRRQPFPFCLLCCPAFHVHLQNLPIEDGILESIISNPQHWVPNSRPTLATNQATNLGCHACGFLLGTQLPQC